MLSKLEPKENTTELDQSTASTSSSKRRALQKTSSKAPSIDSSSREREASTTRTTMVNSPAIPSLPAKTSSLLSSAFPR